MAAVQMKPEYGPTLGRLLAPRWHAASRPARATVLCAASVLVALLVAAALTLENSGFSRGGPVPFSFEYRDLYRVAPDPGGFVKVQRHRPDGALEDSYAVDPLRLPPYSGELSGYLPVYAASYIRQLGRRYRDFVLTGEGKTRVDSIYGYDVFYTAVVDGREMFGRDVLLLPERPGVREGVEIVMLTSPTASSEVTAPSEVASAGVLERPLKSFAFG